MRISDLSSDVCSSDLADAVHRGVAAADDDDMLALGVEATVIEGGNVVAEALAVRRDQVIERGDHASSGIAGDVDLARLVDARRDQERVMLLAQRVPCRVLADREAEMEMDAALDEPVDAAHHHILLALEARDAIGEESEIGRASCRERECQNV